MALLTFTAIPIQDVILWVQVMVVLSQFGLVVSEALLIYQFIFIQLVASHLEQSILSTTQQKLKEEDSKMQIFGYEVDGKRVLIGGGVIVIMTGVTAAIIYHAVDSA